MTTDTITDDTLAELVDEYRATYGMNAALSSASMRSDAAALRKMAEPALGSKRRTDLQQQLARYAVNMLRGARLVEMIEQRGRLL